jgi:hypothetical protein
MLNIFKSTIIVLLSFFVLVIPRYATAELQSIDDPIYGVGSITHDTETGLEWLDLTFTLNMTRSEVTDELGPEGNFAGFRRASKDEVVDLLIRAVPSWPHTPSYTPFELSNDPEVVAETDALVGMIGPTHAVRGHSAIRGLAGDCLMPNQSFSSCPMVYVHHVGWSAVIFSYSLKDPETFVGAHFLVRSARLSMR